MLRGDILGAIKYLTETEKGGVLMPDDIDEKTGDSVEDILKLKHPNARVPIFDELPEFVDIDITADTVEKVA